MYRNRVDSIASHYRLVGQGIKSRWEGTFSALIHTGPGATEPPQKWVIGLPSRAKRRGSGVDHPSLFSAQVQERVELHFYSPSRPSQTLLRRNSLYHTVVTHGMKTISNQHRSFSSRDIQYGLQLDHSLNHVNKSSPHIHLVRRNSVLFYNSGLTSLRFKNLAVS